MGSAWTPVALAVVAAVVLWGIAFALIQDCSTDPACVTRACLHACDRPERVLAWSLPVLAAAALAGAAVARRRGERLGSLPVAAVALVSAAFMVVGR